MSLRTWLIKKLGGTDAREPMMCKVVHIEKQAVKLSAAASVDTYSKYLTSSELDEYIKEHLAQQFIDEIINSNLMDIQKIGEDPTRIFYQATLYVVKE